MVVELQAFAESDSPASLLEGIPQLDGIPQAPTRPETPRPKTAEIDARRIVREFRGTRAARPDAAETSDTDASVAASDSNGADFSLECAVDWVPAGEQGVIPTGACPVCGSEWAYSRFAVAGVRSRLVDCIECGVGRLYPAPSAEAIGQFYPPSYYGVTGAKFVPIVEGLVRFVAARHVRSLSRGIPAGGRMLDVGCGRGVLLKSLADRGFEVHGFEISETAAAGADPRADIRIGNSLEDVGYPNAFFDQVILWHVFEHLPNPVEVLDEIRRILKPGGRLVIAVPNYSSLQSRWAGPAWFHLDLPRHLFHFPVKGLRRLLDERGFTRRSEHHFSLRQNPFGWVQSGLNRLSRVPRNGLYTLLKLRGGAEPFGNGVSRAVCKLAYWLGMPVACMASVAEALLRRGATVSIVAENACESVPSNVSAAASTAAASGTQRHGTQRHNDLSPCLQPA